MFFKIAILFAIVSCIQTNENRQLALRSDEVRFKRASLQKHPVLKRSTRDSIGHNRMVNTVYRKNKNQVLNKNGKRQEQKSQQSALMNQYASFFMNLQKSSDQSFESESKPQPSAAELKKQLKAAYREILRQRRQKLREMYG